MEIIYNDCSTHIILPFLAFPKVLTCSNVPKSTLMHQLLLFFGLPGSGKEKYRCSDECFSFSVIVSFASAISIYLLSSNPRLELEVPSKATSNLQGT